MCENTNINEQYNKENQIKLIQMSEHLLESARASIDKPDTLSVPIAKLSTLGTGVASIIPALNTVTQTTSFDTNGLYQLANASVGDALKKAQNGNFWGAFKTAEGTSKFAQLKEVGPVSATTTIAPAFNPATMMMAVALFSIEKDINNITEMEKKILSFLEIEKESEIEADVETLMDIITKYKSNWNNEQFISSNHKLVLDIQRTSRKHMNSYQKKISEFLKSKKVIVIQNRINSIFSEIEKDFQYYRLSLFTFSLSSLMEIMLSGNFNEEYVIGIKNEIRTMSETYRDYFDKCSIKFKKWKILRLALMLQKE